MKTAAQPKAVWKDRERATQRASEYLKVAGSGLRVTVENVPEASSWCGFEPAYAVGLSLQGTFIGWVD